MLDKRDEGHEKKLNSRRTEAAIFCEASRKTVTSISFYDDDTGE